MIKLLAGGTSAGIKEYAGGPATRNMDYAWATRYHRDAGLNRCAVAGIRVPVSYCTVGKC